MKTMMVGKNGCCYLQRLANYLQLTTVWSMSIILSVVTMLVVTHKSSRVQKQDVIFSSKTPSFCICLADCFSGSAGECGSLFCTWSRQWDGTAASHQEPDTSWKLPKMSLCWLYLSEHCVWDMGWSWWGGLQLPGKAAAKLYGHTTKTLWWYVDPSTKHCVPSDDGAGYCEQGVPGIGLLGP